MELLQKSQRHTINRRLFQIVFLNVTTTFLINLSRPGTSIVEAASALALDKQSQPTRGSPDLVDVAATLLRANNNIKAQLEGQPIQQVGDTTSSIRFSSTNRVSGSSSSSSSRSGTSFSERKIQSEGSETSGSVALRQANSVADINALNYLQKYGYMSANANLEANNLITEDSLASAITSFQRFAGIPETGVVDEQTLRFMEMPRCGNSDKPLTAGRSSRLVSKVGKLRRRKRYALQGSKWRRQELTYRISQYPTRFNGRRHEVDGQIERAFGIWSQVAPISFVVKREGRVHIDIRFANGDHGDGDAFDGPGNTLAHAYFPQYGGDAHFDDQEYWTIDSYAGTNIFQVAAHELGHSLGLGHSNVREALMAPFYQKYKPNFKLHIDDVLAIQALYGEKPFLAEIPQTTSISSGGDSQASTTTTTTTTTTSTTTTTTPSTRSQREQPTTWYSMFSHGNKPTLFGSQPADERPPTRETSEDESPSTSGNNNNSNGLPDLSGLGGNGIGPEDGPPMIGANQPPSSLGGSYPSSGRPIHQPAPADLCSDPVIDAITRTEDGGSYVFKGDYYWLLTSDGIAKGYPRKIATDWDGLPSNLDAALTWADGKTFFFKGNKYWRYRNKRREVGYPKLISAGFAGIPDDIDAAFVWSGNGRTYFFKGTEYWRFDSRADPPVSSEYPRSIKVWNGLPSYVNAAFKWENNVTYFFKGSQYYRFNDKEFKVESRGRPPFPRQSAEWWFSCPSNSAQRAAFSSSLKDRPLDRDDGGINGGHGSGNGNTNSQADTDWSFLAGLDESTRILGTHISDHKPQPPPGSFFAPANSELDSDSGLLLPRATVPSSAISSFTFSITNWPNQLTSIVILGAILAASLSDVVIYIKSPEGFKRLPAAAAAI